MFQGRNKSEGKKHRVLWHPLVTPIANTLLWGLFGTAGKGSSLGVHKFPCLGANVIFLPTLSYW